MIRIRRLAPQLAHGLAALAVLGSLVAFEHTQRAVPETVDGKMIGFKLQDIDADSAYAKAGLRSGDVLVEIDGQSLTDTAESIRIMQATKDKPSIPVIVLRDGKRLTFQLPAPTTEPTGRTLK